MATAKHLASQYDLIVVGGGPAGAAAAIRARSLGRSVVIIERAEFPRTCRCCGWIGPAGVSQVTKLGVSAELASAREFAGMRIHSWDLRQSADVIADDVHGWIVDRAVFDAALLRCAEECGADVALSVNCTEVEIGEREVSCGLSDGHELTGQVLILADGIDSPTARLAGVPAAGQFLHHPSCAFAEFRPASDEPSIELALAASREGKLATIVQGGGVGRLALISREQGADLHGEFEGFLERAREAGLLASDVAPEPQLSYTAAGLALDLDHHVGKRALLVGDAGGFVSAFSHEGIYPAMCSGQLAAEVASEALDEPVLQDALQVFAERWRAALADYLRLPNSDLALLVPLVFNNAQMSTRIARSFLVGTAF